MNRIHGVGKVLHLLDSFMCLINLARTTAFEISFSFGFSYIALQWEWKCGEQLPSGPRHPANGTCSFDRARASWKTLNNRIMLPTLSSASSSVERAEARGFQWIPWRERKLRFVIHGKKRASMMFWGKGWRSLFLKQTHVLHVDVWMQLRMWRGEALTIRSTRKPSNFEVGGKDFEVIFLINFIKRRLLCKSLAFAVGWRGRDQRETS